MKPRPFRPGRKHPEMAMGRARPNEFHPAMASGPLGGRIALVTGSTSGIGLGIARVLATAGADIVLNGFGEAAKIEKAQAGIAADHGVRAAFVGADLGKADGCTRLIVEAERVLGRIDILVNNAGIQHTAPVEAFPPERWDAIIALNLTAAFHTMRAAIPGMKTKGWGRIVTISSIWGKISRAGRGSYSTSKFAVDGMTAALAAEVAEHGILANCVAPGFIDTDLTRRVLGEDGMRQVAAQVPMRRLGRVEEIAAFVAWLVGPENTYISGQNIAIDGGFTRV